MSNTTIYKLPNGREGKHAKKPSILAGCTEIIPEEKPDYENYVKVGGRKYYPSHYTHVDATKAVDGAVTRAMAIDNFGFTQTYGELYDNYLQKLRAAGDPRLETEENSLERAWIRNSDPNIRTAEETAVEEGIWTQLNVAETAHDFNIFDANYFTACNEIDNYLNAPCQ